MNAGDARIQSNGVGVGNEMDIVPPHSKFKAEFRSDDAAAAVRWVAGDSDFHLLTDCKDRVADLPVEVLGRLGLVAAAEPHAHPIAFDQHRRIADHFAVPGQVSA